MSSRYRWVVSSTALVVVAFAAGCVSSSPMSRIDANRGLYESWPLEVQEAVLSGKVEKGMTPEQVQMSIGKPSQTYTRPGRTSEQVIWVYTKGGDGGPMKNTSVSVGGGIGGIGVGGGVPIGGGGGGYEEKREVVFENGQVVSSDFGQ